MHWFIQMEDIAGAPAQVSRDNSDGELASVMLSPRLGGQFP